ncbi:MAG TPA: HAD family phosphatase [Pyrinomonadaceae bacterium]|jgi:beta-phosphoglucomutase
MIDYTNRAFIFDMDGTLVDNMRFHAEAWRTMLAENNLNVDMNEFLVKTAGKTNREIIPNFFADATDEKLLELGERKETLYRELFLAERRAVKGAIEFLKEAQDLGVKMAVATAAPVKNVEFILDGLDLRHYFQAITTAADVKNGKPDPEVFLKSAEKLGVAPKNCLVFEDALNGFEAARRAGMKSVAITTVNKREVLEKLDSVVEIVEDYTEISPLELIEKHLSETIYKANK